MPVELDLVPPPDVAVSATVNAAVMNPAGAPFWRSDLSPQEGNRYAAAEPLQLPLLPPEGNWGLVVRVQSELDVEGLRQFAFLPDPISFRDLSGLLPAGVDLRLPQEFMEAAAQGDLRAGGRAWRYGDGEVALWWAPGPIEPLLLNNALVMLETTHDPSMPPRVRDVEETEWQGQTAFLFYEEWPEGQPGVDAGPAEALVVQAPDYWLYVLRVRAINTDTIPPLLPYVRRTLTFSPQ